jgi:hypothetical protein
MMRTRTRCPFCTGHVFTVLSRGGNGSAEPQRYQGLMMEGELSTGHHSTAEVSGPQTTRRVFRGAST